MTNTQANRIREKATWTSWKYPVNRAVKVRQLLFDLYELLPDDNVLAYLRDCPAPGRWSYVTDDDTGEKKWFWCEPFEQRQWYVSCEIKLKDTLGLSGILMLDRQHAEEEKALCALIGVLREATDYTARKSTEEIAAMREEFKKLRLAGPPKEQEENQDGR